MCSAGACKCRPTTGNLIQNPNFDGALFSTTGNGWRNDYPDYPSIAVSVTDDADSCTASGSVRLYYYYFYMGRVSQAINVNASTTYYLGYKYKQSSPYTGAVSCLVFLYSGTRNSVTNLCTGTQSSDSIIITSGAPPVQVPWATKSGSFTTRSDTRCVDVQCQTNGDYAWFDQIYMNSTGLPY